MQATTRAPAAKAALHDASVVLDDRSVLRRVDATFSPGLTVIRGANGAGKTTLLRAIAGLVPLARGSRSVAGDLLYVGHRAQLLRGLSAAENLAFFSRFRGHRGDDKLRAALVSWGIADGTRPVEHLSAGQRRRVALARIDAEDPDVILLDEPFAELDADGAALLHEALARARARAATLVIASHAHEELDRTADACWTIENGQLRAS